MLDIFDILCRLNGGVSPSGHEDAVANAIIDVGAPFADSVERDAMGNLILRKKGRGGKKIMLSAHMDSIGVIVTFIDDKGFLRFSNLGGLSPVLLLSTPVRFANGTHGVIFKDGKAKIAELKFSDLFIDIGASSREEAERLVSIADVAVYDTPSFMAGDYIVSPYLDNRISCVALLAALVEAGDVYNEVAFVFSAQEEVGVRGATTAAFALEPDVGIAVDVTRTGDTPDPQPRMACELGGGAAIKVMDSSLICSPRLVAALKKCADDNGIKRQTEVLEAGGTDASAMQRARGGAYAGAVSIPTRYIHSPQEMCSLSDVVETARLIAAFIRDDITL